MPALSSQTLIATSLVQLRDVQCSACRGKHVGAPECDPVSHIVIPYRGNFVRRVGTRVAHADVNQALFFSATQEYRIDHATDEGDACLALQLREDVLRELARPEALARTGVVSFRELQQRIDPALQLHVARLRHARVDSLRAEELALRLGRQLLNENSSRRPTSAAGTRLVNRAKQILQSRPGWRWSLEGIAREVGVSPVHLTQTFSKIEGMPLYRYQTQLRLALALHRLPHVEDLTTLALDLGFSSHSQFTTAFKRMYGIPPSIQRADNWGSSDDADRLDQR